MATADYEAQELQEFLDDAADMGAERIGNYGLYDNYYSGIQEARLNDRARQYLERHGVNFCENFTETMVDVVSERLKVEGFDSDPDADEDEVIEELRAWWERSRMDVWQDVIHSQSIRLGDSFAIVDYASEGYPRITWNDAYLIKPTYSSEYPGVLDWACKRWETQKKGPQNPEGRKVTRLNLYYPDRVERWFRAGSDSGEWSNWKDSPNETWPLWWTDTGEEDGDPLGVPVFHFRFKPLGGHYGRSRVRQFMPFQDELNKYVIDLNVILDNQGFRQRWASGIPDAAASSLENYAGNLWHTAAAEASFGEFEADSGEGVLKAIDGVLSRGARKMRVPLHLLQGGDIPSGEALKSAEAGLVETVKDYTQSNGPVWEDALRMMLRLEAVFGENAVVPLEEISELPLTVNWANPHSRSDKDDLEAAVLKRDLGVSEETLLAELGYDPAKEKERREEEKGTLDEAAGRQLDAGLALEGMV